MRTLLLTLLLWLLPTLVHAQVPRLSSFDVRAALGQVEHASGMATYVGALATLSVSFDAPPLAITPPKAFADPARTAEAVRRATDLSPKLVRKTLAAAYRAAGLGANERTVDSALSRGRVAAVLPEISLRGAQYSGLDTVLYDPGSSASSRDQFRNTRTLEAKVAWKLDRLVYGPDEPGLERLRSERLELKLRIAHRVIEALVQRHRALFDLQRLDPISVEAEEAGLKLAEAEATLEALTGGHFRAGCSAECE